jgi:LysM repeat protein
MKYINPKRNKPTNTHVVKAGESLCGIAVNHGTTVENLRATNGLQSDLLFVGQKLLVPIMYEVVYGDTLGKIASTFHTTVQIIITKNKLPSDFIYVGQRLKIIPKRMAMQGQYILMSKEEFKNWLFNQIVNRKIKLIQQHHTWDPSYKDFNGSNHFELLTRMESYHVSQVGWPNIAQNLTTFPDGTVAVCRPFNMAPDGTLGQEAKTAGIMIENLGNFDIGHDVMTEKQKETIVYSTALLCIKFGLIPSIESITYHHWWDMVTGEKVLDNSEGHIVKTCPGTGFFWGNSTQSAVKNFYPLVRRKIQEILDTLH